MQLKCSEDVLAEFWVGVHIVQKSSAVYFEAVLANFKVRTLELPM